MTDIRPFLRLQSDDWLTALRDKLASDLLANVRYTAITLNGKTTAQDTQFQTAEMAKQLAEVLIERGLQGAAYIAPTRTTLARFV
jgi:hypothetical protein